MSKLTAKSGKLSAILATMSPAERAKYVPRCKPVELANRPVERGDLVSLSNETIRHIPGLQFIYRA